MIAENTSDEFHDRLSGAGEKEHFVPINTSYLRHEESPARPFNVNISAILKIK
jgi:hypothetical protein